MPDLRAAFKKLKPPEEKPAPGLSALAKLKVAPEVPEPDEEYAKRFVEDDDETAEGIGRDEYGSPVDLWYPVGPFFVPKTAEDLLSRDFSKLPVARMSKKGRRKGLYATPTEGCLCLYKQGPCWLHMNRFGLEKQFGG